MTTKITSEIQLPLASQNAIQHWNMHESPACSLRTPDTLILPDWSHLDKIVVLVLKQRSNSKVKVLASAWGHCMEDGKKKYTFYWCFTDVFFVALQQWSYWKDPEHLFSKQTDLSHFFWDKLIQVCILCLSGAESQLPATQVALKSIQIACHSSVQETSNNHRNSGDLGFKA